MYELKGVEGIRRKRLWIVGSYLEYYHPYAPICSLADSPADAEVALFAGGSDVTPGLYHEKNVASGNHVQRDVEEAALFREFYYRKTPMIGICRGSQFLTVMLGGKLYQDVTGHGGDHNITTVDGEEVLMSSTHHQMMRPRGKFELLAWTPHRSKHYLTGEGVVEPELEVDPEVVFYPKANVLCIQGHPEHFDVDTPTNQYVRGLIQKYLFKEAVKQ